MFTANDVRSLLGILQSANPTGDQFPNVFLPSLNGTNLVSLSVARAKLRDLIDRRGNVSVADIPHLLDIKDATELIRWADEQPDLSTPDNGRSSIPPWVQKVIAIHFYNAIKYSFLSTRDMALFWSITENDFEKIITVYRRSFFVPRQCSWYYASPGLVERTQARLLAICRTAESEAVSISVTQKLKHLPAEVLEDLSGRLHSGPHELLPFELHAKPDGLWFVPAEAIKRRREASQQSSLERYAQQLKLDGFCIVKDESSEVSHIRDQLLSSGDGQTLELSKHADTPSNDWPSDTIALVRQDHLNTTLDSFSSHIPEVAASIWQSTRETDSTFSSAVRSTLLASISPSNPIHPLILLSSNSSPLRQYYTLSHAEQHSTASRLLHHHLFLTLHAPIALYLSGLDITSSDPTLHEHQYTFLTTHFTTELIPAALALPATIYAPRQAEKEITRFRSSISSSPSVAGISTALKRLERKTSVSDTRLPSLVEVRDSYLTPLPGKLRPSDVLQRGTWTLLACRADRTALFLGAGRDAGRFVKVFRSLADTDGGEGEMDWSSAAGKLEELRAALKAGTDTSGLEGEIRDLVIRGIEHRCLRDTP